LELFDLIAGQSPSVAALIIMAYLYNKNYLDSLRERKEILESLQAERQEWIATLQRIMDHYDARLVAVIETMADMKGQLHALRGKLTEHMLVAETWMRGQSGGKNAQS
jgi:hypothetical protein